MALDIKSRNQNQVNCSVVLEILDDILLDSIRTATPDLNEGLTDMVSNIYSKNVRQPIAAPKATNAVHSSSKSSTDSDSNSESDASSSTSSTSRAERNDSHEIKKADLAGVVQESKPEGDSRHLRSKNEIDPDKVAVPTPNIIITDEDEIIPIGKIVSAMESVVVVSTADWRPNDEAKQGRERQPKTTPFSTNLSSVIALDHGSALCFENRKLLGLVDETFGPVECPFYVVRFSTAEERDASGATRGQMVYLVKQKSTWVRGSDVLSKGYDTSNWDDEECNVPEEYSDDEEERAAKKALRRTRGQKRENSMTSSDEQKRRRLSASYPKRDLRHPSEPHDKTVRRSGQRGRPRTRHGMNPNLRHRSDTGVDRRLGGGPMSAPICHTPEVGDQQRGEPSTAGGTQGMHGVVSPDLHALARYPFPPNIQRQRGYIGSPPIGSVPLPPNGQRQQLYHYHGLSDYRSPYGFMGGAVPGANAGVPHHNSVHGHYVTHRMVNSREQYNVVQTPYWHGGIPAQMYSQRNTAEVGQSGSFSAEPMDRQSRVFYEGPMSQQQRHEGMNHMGPPRLSSYQPFGFASYSPGMGAPLHVNQEFSLEQYQQQTSYHPPSSGGR
ncbi:snoRNP assembly factor Naf1 [Gracilaria domingensis]|nr:snoRNP assembly factor Naf1 [Gracilaria domingensis]